MIMDNTAADIFDSKLLDESATLASCEPDVLNEPFIAGEEWKVIMF